jgi:beta-phosphoglucomutase-like phosphatase (HAD superfamily)
MGVLVDIPAIGPISSRSGMVPLERSADGVHRVGVNGVVSITATGDRKVEFVACADHTLAYVRSALGYPAYYPVRPVEWRRPVRAVLMDLDGTSVRSEDFWIWMIQLSIGSLLDRPEFELEEADLPHVSGHSVSEHLEYGIRKYCPDRTVEQARHYYFQHTRRELAEVLAGRGRTDAFKPTPGLKPFLQGLKARGARVALVTSGLYEKAWPEIVSAFRQLGLGDPKAFYDAIITAGFALHAGEVGTLGELEPKPHPWLYAEASRVGLGVPVEDRHQVVGLEDSGAGVCAVRLAGFSPIGFAGGNIDASGTRELCSASCERLDEVLDLISG